MHTLSENKEKLKNNEEEFNSNEKLRIEYLRMQNKVRDFQKQIEELNYQIEEISIQQEGTILTSINTRSEVSNIVALVNDLYDSIFTEMFKKKKQTVEFKENVNPDELNLSDLNLKFEDFK